jgi:hypothetical protein
LLISQLIRNVKTADSLRALTLKSKAGGYNWDYIELKERNIKLVGLAFAQLKYKPLKEKQQDKKSVNIIIDELSKITLNINIDTNVKLEQKDKYISGGMQ